VSAHVPQQPDLAAVRALRRAATSLREPLGALSLTLAAAEQLPAVLSPAFDLVSFSPFGAIPEVAGTAGAQPSAAGSPRRQAPTPGSLLDQAGAAAGQAAGARAATVPARRASSSSAAPPDDGFFPTVVGAVTKVATTATTVAAASVEALAKPGPGTPATPTPRAAPSGPAGAIGDAIALVGELAGQVEDTVARTTVGLAGGDQTEIPPRAPALGQAGTSILDAVTSMVGEAIETTAGVAGPKGATVGRTIAEGISKAVDVAVPTPPSLYDVLSASLLMTEFETTLAQLQTQASAGSPAAQVPGAPAQSATPKPAAAANGTVVQAAPPEPADLAWLVNEALIEQARRHGMDLS
jgi:hypothetical protein